MIAVITMLLAMCTNQTAPVDLGAWEAGDREARWMLLEQDVARSGWQNLDAWLEFLGERNELELMEWIGLFEPREGAFGKVSDALARRDAPQWARLQAWSLRSKDSHVNVAARSALMERRPGHALDWLERHEASLDGAARGLLQELRARQPVRADASAALPSWTAAGLLPHLQDTSRPVVELGPHARAEPGVVYVHQIERELRALAAAQLFADPWGTRVLELTRHENERVCVLAWLAFTKAPAEAIPLRPAILTSEDANAPVPVRSAAVAALSFAQAPQPRAWAKLHEIARRPDHPGFAVAVSRLADLGDEFTLEYLRRAASEVPATQAKLLVEQSARLEQRLRQDPRSRAVEDIPLLLERTGWVDLAGDSIEAERRAWMKSYLGAHATDGAARAALEQLEKSYEPALTLDAGDGDAAARMSNLRERVRSYARELLGR